MTGSYPGFPEAIRYTIAVFARMLAGTALAGFLLILIAMSLQYTLHADNSTSCPLAANTESVQDAGGRCWPISPWYGEISHENNPACKVTGKAIRMETYSEIIDSILRGERSANEYERMGMEMFKRGLVSLDPLGIGACAFPLTQKGRERALELRSK